jgi:hypothetical protein
MSQKNRRFLIMLGVVVLVSVSCLAQKEGASQVTADEILRILDSKDVKEVSSSFDKSQKLYCDRVAQAFQQYRLNHGSEQGLYAVLPSSAQQIKELYQLTVLNPPAGHEELVALYEGFFQTVFKAAPRHPESFQLLFSVATNFDSRLSEGEQQWFCDLLHGLYVSAPDSYLKALAGHRNRRQMILVCAAGCSDSAE